MKSPYAMNDGKLLGVPMTGMNRYFVASSGIDTMTGAFSAGNNFMNNAWDDNPNKFQQLGSDTGTVIDSGLMLGMTGIMAAQHARAMGTTQGMVYGGQTYSKLTAGGWENIGSKKVMQEAEMAKYMKMGKDSAFKVNIRNGQAFESGAGSFLKRGAGTYRPMGGWGIAKMAVAQLAVGAVAKIGLGLVGKVLDSAYSESKHFRKPQYDNRFYNTQQNDASSYQQLGQAMESYENKMMSVARIYHAR